MSVLLKNTSKLEYKLKQQPIFEEYIKISQN